HQKAAEYRAHTVVIKRRLVGVQRQQAAVLLVSGKPVACTGAEFRSQNSFHEEAGFIQRLSELLFYGAINGNHAAKGRDRVGGQGVGKGLGQRARVAGNTAGGEVLDDNDRGLLEAGYRTAGSVEIEQVVVG